MSPLRGRVGAVGSVAVRSEPIIVIAAPFVLAVPSQLAVCLLVSPHPPASPGGGSPRPPRRPTDVRVCGISPHQPLVGWQLLLSPALQAPAQLPGKGSLSF